MKMWFLWFMLGCDILIPIIMIILGIVLVKHPPKNINGFIGYRTSRSMKNEETWLFAQKYCGRLWQITGWIMLFPSAAVHIPFYGGNSDSVGTLGIVLMIIQTAALLVTVALTEKELKKKFD